MATPDMLGDAAHENRGEDGPRMDLLFVGIRSGQTSATTLNRIAVGRSSCCRAITSCSTRSATVRSPMNSRRLAFKRWASINGGCRWSSSGGGAVLVGLLAPLAALGLLVLILVAIATSGRQRIKLYKPIDRGDRIDDWLYLPETLYAFMLILIVSAGPDLTASMP